jgi:hypothetical protein
VARQRDLSSSISQHVASAVAMAAVVCKTTAMFPPSLRGCASPGCDCARGRLVLYPGAGPRCLRRGAGALGIAARCRLRPAAVRAYMYRPASAGRGPSCVPLQPTHPRRALVAASTHPCGPVRVGRGGGGGGGLPPRGGTLAARPIYSRASRAGRWPAGRQPPAQLASTVLGSYSSRS